ncbi:LysM domain-containing protein [Variovorax sp. 770b2]|uniref:LysM peptidoglycan-binding domain-containing protein n=1 Tax=Variovorax sp. 770b2 TaxID=1566271 RepID=UPI0008E8AC2C|nr:LysM domain-containing protein [Variovorax sp. 770b2]SFQ08713.1 LysM domain-containing protein [Variovorax sp. 770b2]
MNTTAGHPAARHAAPKPKPRTGFEKWEDNIDKADDRWNAYDCEIRSAVDEYDRHLSRTPGYVPLDWRVVKAMLWVETGANLPQWRSAPMQIGNNSDPGLMALLGGKEGGDLIIPPSFRVGLSVGAVKSAPTHNIRAGIGYLLMRMANFEFKSVPDRDTQTYDVTVRAGDSIDKIARAQGSTPEVMRKLNPSSYLLKPGDVLKYQKASIQRVVTGWKPITPSGVATYYNAGGDSMYARKMDHALGAVRQAKGATCN